MQQAHPDKLAIRIFTSNLLLRILLVGFVLVTGRWYFGDAYSYLYYAAEVCAGAWGGEPGRPPLYLWYLCGLSPGVNRPGTVATLALPLLFQTILVWCAGVFYFLRTKNRKLTTLWLFDPVLLIYSCFAMTDALFSAGLLALSALMGELTTKGFNRRLILPTGVFMALLMLLRPNGQIVALWSLSILFIAAPRKNWKSVFATVSLIFALIFPRLWWNHSNHDGFTLAKQGGGWLASVAAQVVYSDRNLPSQEAEKLWFEARPASTTSEIVAELVKHFPKWVYLSGKGVARVLFGHVNTESGYLLTGKAPVGPAWFKPPESRDDARVQGITVAFWVLGLAFTAAFAGYFYFSVFSGFRLSAIRSWPLFAWALLGALLMSALPQVYGEARFRLAVWPFLMVLPLVLRKGKE